MIKAHRHTQTHTQTPENSTTYVRCNTDSRFLYHTKLMVLPARRAKAPSTEHMRYTTAPYMICKYAS